jgi:hypothetical protein
MTIESLVHSNPTSPVMGNQSAAERRRRLKKPSIDMYFMQMPTSMRRESGTWNGVNSKRIREDDGGRPEASKRMYSS